MTKIKISKNNMKKSANTRWSLINNYAAQQLTNITSY